MCSFVGPILRSSEFGAEILFSVCLWPCDSEIDLGVMLVDPGLGSFSCAW
uniref:Uncharacterized protein n=1 Tax=Manihot esculenta TaxID=3983 RepID=A0A2C9W4R4_MANES